MRLRERLCAGLFLLACTTTGAHAVTSHPATFLHVVDGDNVWLNIQVYQQLRSEDNFRLNGIDTPESNWRAKCPEEKALGNTVKANLEGILSEAKSIRVHVMDDDEKFGRPLIELYADGVWVNQEMINRGWARPYHGEKKSSWCP